MINYELAKELKDAGFPESDSWIEMESKSGLYFDTCDGVDYISLSELIEACPQHLPDGENEPKSFNLAPTYNETGWIACYICFDEVTEYLSEGKTPLEAVAKLWLALNKK